MSIDTKTHVRVASIEQCDGELLINTVPISRLAATVGRTPFYAYDRGALSKRVADVRAALPGQVKLDYAIKANPMPALVAHMRTLVDGFDVASHREMLTALDSGMTASAISFAGPAKQDSELRSAVAAGVSINCESETELTRIARHAERLGLAGRVTIRVNPAFELKGSGMKMSGSPKQFGIDEHRVPAAIRQVREYGLTFVGLQVYCGSQNLDATSIIEANRQTIALAIRLCDAAGAQPQCLNIGGGYGIPYFPGESPLDLPRVGSALGETLDHHATALGSLDVIVEIGRYLVGEAGYYISRVSDIKLSQGHAFVMVDGGLHHHLANSGNLGQFLRKNYPVIAATKLDQNARDTVTIVGPLCTPLDIVADRISVPKLEIGDLIAVLQSGAYGYTASPHGFLGHPPPVEILV